MKHPYTLELYLGGNGKQYFWRMKRKGRIVMDGSQDYPTKKKLERATSQLMKTLFRDGAVRIKDIAFPDDE